MILLLVFIYFFGIKIQAQIPDSVNYNYNSSVPSVNLNQSITASNFNFLPTPPNQCVYGYNYNTGENYTGNSVYTGFYCLLPGSGSAQYQLPGGNIDGVEENCTNNSFTIQSLFAGYSFPTTEEFTIYTRAVGEFNNNVAYSYYVPGDGGSEGNWFTGYQCTFSNFTGYGKLNVCQNISTLVVTNDTIITPVDMQINGGVINLDQPDLYFVTGSLYNNSPNSEYFTSGDISNGFIFTPTGLGKVPVTFTNTNQCGISKTSFGYITVSGFNANQSISINTYFRNVYKETNGTSTATYSFNNKTNSQTWDTVVFYETYPNFNFSLWLNKLASRNDILISRTVNGISATYTETEELFVYANVSSGGSLSDSTNYVGITKIPTFKITDPISESALSFKSLYNNKNCSGGAQDSLTYYFLLQGTGPAKYYYLGTEQDGTEYPFDPNSPVTQTISNATLPLTESFNIYTKAAGTFSDVISFYDCLGCGAGGSNEMVYNCESRNYKGYGIINIEQNISSLNVNPDTVITAADIKSNNGVINLDQPNIYFITGSLFNNSASSEGFSSPYVTNGFTFTPTGIGKYPVTYTNTNVYDITKTFHGYITVSGFCKEQLVPVTTYFRNLNTQTYSNGTAHYHFKNHTNGATWDTSITSSSYQAFQNFSFNFKLWNNPNHLLLSGSEPKNDILVTRTVTGNTATYTETEEMFVYSNITNSFINWNNTIEEGTNINITNANISNPYTKDSFDYILFSGTNVLTNTYIPTTGYLGYVNLSGVIYDLSGCPVSVNDTATVSGQCSYQNITLQDYFPGNYQSYSFSSTSMTYTFSCNGKSIKTTNTGSDFIALANAVYNPSTGILTFNGQNISLGKLTFEDGTNELYIKRVFTGTLSGGGTISNTENVTLLVENNLHFSIVGLPENSCVNTTIDLKTYISPSDYTTITFKDSTTNTTISNTGALNYALTHVGLNLLKVTILYNGCNETLWGNYSVQALPVINLSDVPAEVCESAGEIQLFATATPIGGTGYFEGLSDNILPIVNNPAVTSYPVTYTYTDLYGCTSSKSTTIGAVPSATPGYNAPAYYCTNQGVVALSGGYPAGGFYYNSDSLITDTLKLLCNGVTTAFGTPTSIANFFINNGSPYYTLSVGEVEPEQDIFSRTLLKFDFSGIDKSKFIYNATLVLHGVTGITNHKYGKIGLMAANWTDGTDGEGPITAYNNLAFSTIDSTNIAPFLVPTTNNSMVLGSGNFTNWVNKWDTSQFYGIYLDWDYIHLDMDNYYSKEYNKGDSAPSLVVQYYKKISTINLNNYKNANKVDITYQKALNGCSGLKPQTIPIDTGRTITFNPYGFPYSESNHLCYDTLAHNLDQMSIIQGGTFTSNKGGVYGNMLYPSITGSGPLILTYTLNDGCNSSASDTIMINPLPDAGFTTDSTAVCDLGTINLNKDVKNNYPTGNSFSGLGVVDTLFYAGKAMNANMNVVTHLCTDLNGCKNSANMGIYVKPLVPIRHGQYDNIFDFISSVPLNQDKPDSGTGTITYSGNGVTPLKDTDYFEAEQAIAKYYPGMDSGSFKIHMSYIASNGCTTYDSMTIQVVPFPVTLRNIGNFCNNDAQNYTLNEGSYENSLLSFGGYTYQANSYYQCNDTLIVNNSILSPTIAKPGNYYVTYLVKVKTQDNNIKTYSSDSVPVTIYSTPVTPDVALDTVYCKNTLVSLNATGTQSTDNVIWTSGKDTIGVSKNINIRLLNDSIVFIINKSIEGCRSMPEEIQLNTDPATANFVVLTPVIFENDSIHAIAFDNNAKTYSWTINNKNYSNQNLNIKSNTAGINPGKYDVSLQVTSDHNCSSYTIVDSVITIHPYPVTIKETADGCKNDTGYDLHFATVDTSFLKIEKDWYTGNAVQNNELIPLKALTGNNKVIFNLLTMAGRTFTDSTTVFLNSNPGLPVVDYKTVYCKNTTDTLVISNINLEDTLKGMWYYQNQLLGSGKSFILKLTNDSTMIVKILSDEGCYSDPQTINLVTDKVSADFTTSTTVIALGAPIQFYPADTTGIKYQWTFGEWGSSLFEKPVYVFNYNGYYNIGLIVTSPDNCTDTVMKMSYLTVNLTDNIDEAISVYPNPVSDKIIISDNSQILTDIKVYNIPGVLIYDIKPVGNLTEINVHDLPSGAYEILLNNKKTITIIKQ